jgi:hypothetical protein
VALDSVGYDFLLAEWPQEVSIGDGSAQDYLHEAAQADAPPSGTFYDPEGDGKAMTSLGVHEHWNNPVDKQYSRNLGIGAGIELISSDPLTCKGDFNEDGDIDGSDLAEYIRADDGMNLADFAGNFGKTDCPD